MRFTPAVSRLVEPEGDTISPQVNDIGGAGAVDICEPDVFLIEVIGVVEKRSSIHRHLGCEVPVACVGPVADLAIANAYDVGEAIACHVCQVDRLGAVGKDQTGAFFFIEWLANRFG